MAGGAGESVVLDAAGRGGEVFDWDDNDLPRDPKHGVREFMAIIDPPRSSSSPSAQPKNKP
jgi:hypothetical protein